jgi:hypothetical protein
MDILPEHDALAADTPTLLSYEQDVAYEDQVQAAPTPPSLADRIGRNKVYLLSESSVSRGSKVRVCSVIEFAPKGPNEDVGLRGVSKHPYCIRGNATTRKSNSTSSPMSQI